MNSSLCSNHVVTAQLRAKQIALSLTHLNMQHSGVSLLSNPIEVNDASPFFKSGEFCII